MLSGIFTKPTIDIILDEIEGRKKATIYEINGTITRLPLFYDKEDISGKIILKIPQGKTFEHKGIKLELMGIIKSLSDPNDILKFISLTSELESIGILSKEINIFDFKFTSVQKQFETYHGKLKNIIYLLKITIDTSFRTLSYEQEFAVYNPEPISVLNENDNPIKLEVGVDEWLKIIFEVDSRNFDIKGLIVGRVTFKKVSIRLNSMEVRIIKKESINTQDNKPLYQDIIAYEIMDGGPIKNEIVPIRLYLKPYGLTPTMNNVNNRLCVTYLISLVLIDIEDRQYFKKHEIILHRIEKKK